MIRRTPVRAVLALPLVLLGLTAAGCGGESDDPHANRTATEAQTTSRPGPATEAPSSPRKATTPAPAPAPLPIDQALGQLVLGRFIGPQPPAALLAQIRAGHVGGVTLYGDNVPGDRRSVLALTTQLQDAAREGGRPPLLIAIDHEGGRVRRIPGPPHMPAREMTSAAIAREQGRAAGRLLRARGINLNLAPVGDVALPGEDGILRKRTFSTDPDEVAIRACAFAEGVASARVGSVLKHFPGLGTTSLHTDERTSTIDLSAARLRRDYAAYRRCGSVPTTMVMPSSAVYPRLLGPEPAVLTPELYSRELRDAADTPLTISDALDTPAFVDEPTPARRALLAGVDLLLHSGADRSADIYAALLADVRSGRIPEARVQEAAARVVAYKQRLSTRDRR